ncbi:hypothetical protein FISHEDRAFT_44837 [Fistulina hepatica ATCC 64428]|uniref:Uncharacterized protein n=1 Tax=Fistulina hepatica ATCC 64428 TaxID=1128425 RepID=A0A0D7A9N4_9AGAR|nr:hypothetical protein FISHEDRAFT_44837 [Fistulina hepatica ATCC 64428]
MFYVALLLHLSFAVTALGQALTTLPFNFTLAATNLTLPNANSTGAPLVLGTDGASTGLEYYTTSTWYTYPYDDYPTLGLLDGELQAFTKEGEWITNATSLTSGSAMLWMTSRLFSVPLFSEYSAVGNDSASVNNITYYSLAVFNHTDLWSLCPDGGVGGQTIVVYNVSAAKSGEFTDCYDVNLNIVPA